MIWQILPSLDSIQQDHTLLSEVDRNHPAYILETPARKSWILRPLPEQGGSSLPDPMAACILDESDLRNPRIWGLLLRLTSLHRARLARYSALNPEIPAEIFLSLLGSPVHYRSLAEWEELGGLEESTIRLAEEYDFPLGVLRLWNRMAQKERDRWERLWHERGLKKNLIREIIQDLYDLSPLHREEALGKAEEFSASWSGRSTPFPGESLRDIVRMLRSPRLEERRNALLGCKKRIAPPRGVHVEIPPDLESSRLTIRFEFDTVELFRKQAEQMLAPDSERALREILGILQE